jgi:hypothetical protein
LFGRNIDIKSARGKGEIHKILKGTLGAANGRIFPSPAGVSAGSIINLHATDAIDVAIRIATGDIRSVQELNYGTPDAPPDDPTAIAFNSAAEAVREKIPEWEQRAASSVGHSVRLIPDVGALDGRLDRIVPFVEIAIEGTLDALVLIRADAALTSKLRGVQKVVIEPCPPGQSKCIASYGSGMLTLCIPLENDARPTDHIAQAIRVAFGAAGH